MCFFKVKHYFGHISGMVGPIDVKRKGSALVGYWIHVKVKFQNSSICRIVGLIDVKWKGSELIWYWAICMTLPIDHTHDLDLGVSRSESEIALSQEWGSLLTMNQKDASHPFITMILTCVTMTGWADVPDSDRGNFRRRRAVYISSYLFLLGLKLIHHGQRGPSQFCGNSLFPCISLLPTCSGGPAAIRVACLYDNCDVSQQNRLTAVDLKRCYVTFTSIHLSASIWYISYMMKWCFSTFLL